MFFSGCWSFDGSAGAAVGAAVAGGSGAGFSVAFGFVVAYQACGVFGLTWFRLACGANLWGWLFCVCWVVGVLGTHFLSYNPVFDIGDGTEEPVGNFLVTCIGGNGGGLLGVGGGVEGKVARRGGC